MKWNDEYNRKMTRAVGDKFKVCQDVKGTHQCIKLDKNLYGCESKHTLPLCASLRCVEAHKDLVRDV